jgi:hypothetical protein
MRSEQATPLTPEQVDEVTVETTEKSDD